MSSVHSLTTVNVYSKTYWTGFIAAVNEEAAYELGLHDKINKDALPTQKRWNAARFTPNIFRHTDVYVDRSTNIDLSSRTIYETHHHYTSSTKPLTKEEQAAKKKEEEENSLQKYKWLGPIVGSIGAFLAAYTWRGYQRCQATYDYTYLVKSGLSYKIDETLTPLKPTLEKIVNNKLEVDAIRYAILKRYFVACAGILVGGGLLTLGAYMKQPSLIPWGGIALAVSAIWAAASAGLHWQDNTDIRALYTAIVGKDHVTETALSHLHWYYQETMILKEEYVQPQTSFVPPPYQPFFNQDYVPVYQASSFTNYNLSSSQYPAGPPLSDSDDD